MHYSMFHTYPEYFGVVVIFRWLMTQRWFDLGHYLNHFLHLQSRVLLTSLFSIIKAIILTKPKFR